MSRFFTLGCSYTYYHFPTWADWIGSTFPAGQYENLGKSGLGNRAIFNRLCELIYKKKLTSDDTVVIAWSTPIREDRWYKNIGWFGLGNIYNQTFFPPGWVKRYFDPFMGLMETINYAHAALNMLDNVGCKYITTWIMLPNKINPKVEVGKGASYIELCDPDNKLWSYLEHVLKHKNMAKIDIDSFVYNLNKKNTLPTIYNIHNSKVDLHPKPIESYFYAKEVLCPALEISNFDHDLTLFNLANDWTNYLSDPVNSFSGINSPLWPKNTPSTFECF